MNYRTTAEQRTTRRILVIAAASVLTIAATGVRLHAGHDNGVTVPPVPTDVEVLAPNEAFLVGHATGTQNYVCLPSGAGVAWTLFTPQATLFSERGRQLTTHFFSPNPLEAGRPERATWQDSEDTSTVWARATGMSLDPNFVAAGAIPWLRLQVKLVGAAEGPRHGDNLTETTFIQRVNTAGGAAPSTGCGVPTDIGNKAFVPYTADYIFYEDADHRGRGGNR
jgi:hypothetical protein